ncbi:hypothetical protein [Streptomyces sp. NPDC001665]
MAGCRVGAALPQAVVVLAAGVGIVHAVTYTDGDTSGEDMSFAARVAEHTAARHTVATGSAEQDSRPSGW